MPAEDADRIARPAGEARRLLLIAGITLYLAVLVLGLALLRGAALADRDLERARRERWVARRRPPRRREAAPPRAASPPAAVTAETRRS
jgi:hypothetical protein